MINANCLSKQCMDIISSLQASCRFVFQLSTLTSQNPTQHTPQSKKNNPHIAKGIASRSTYSLLGVETKTVQKFVSEAISSNLFVQLFCDMNSSVPNSIIIHQTCRPSSQMSCLLSSQSPNMSRENSSFACKYPLHILNKLSDIFKINCKRKL